MKFIEHFYVSQSIENVNKVIGYGATEIIAGSTIFKAEDKKEAIKRLRSNI